MSFIYHINKISSIICCICSGHANLSFGVSNDFLSVYKKIFGALCDASLVILSVILLTVKSPVASVVF